MPKVNRLTFNYLQKLGDENIAVLETNMGGNACPIILYTLFAVSNGKADCDQRHLVTAASQKFSLQKDSIILSSFRCLWVTLGGRV